MCKCVEYVGHSDDTARERDLLAGEPEALELLAREPAGLQRVIPDASAGSATVFAQARRFASV